MNAADSDERTVRRLEAFSDIVIGFSLAQLGAAGVFTKSMALSESGAVAFFASFAIICSLWFFHHRLFENFFAPKSLPIVLNFVWLSIVVLLVYVSVHVAGDGFQSRNPSLLYFGLYALAYFILAAQTLLGMRERRSTEPELRFKAARNVFFMTYWAVVFGVCFALVRLMPWGVPLGNAISATFAIGATGNFAVGLYFRRRRRLQLR